MPTPLSTRERLVRATRESICEVGVGGTTARTITSRAAANLASIPYHFGSKDALVVEALVTEARELIAPVIDLLQSERPAATRATEAVATLTDLFQASRDRVPVYLEALAAATHSDGVAASLTELWQELRRLLADDIARQLAAEALPAWVDPPAMAALILALVNGVVLASVVDPDGPGHAAVAAQFLALLLTAGVAPQGADTDRPGGR